MLRLAEGAGPEPDYVLGADGLATGDRLWTFGFPEGRYQGGKPAKFVCEGFSRIRPAAELQLGRVSGIPIGPGYSGSPVLNRRTGAVCGMLCTSDLRGSAHLLPIARHSFEAESRYKKCAPGARATPASWLDGLDDAQVRAGGRQYPGPALRNYLTLAFGQPNGTRIPVWFQGSLRRRSSRSMFIRKHGRTPAPLTLTGRNRLPARTVLEPPGSVVLIGGAGAGKSACSGQRSPQRSGSGRAGSRSVGFRYGCKPPT